MFSLILNVTRFAVGDFVEGKQFRYTGVYGKIIESVGEKRHIKFQVQFINGKSALLAASSIWPRTYDPTCSYFDEKDGNDDDNFSVGSKASTATNKSTGSAKSNKINTTKKMSLTKNLYIFNYISFVLIGNEVPRKQKLLKILRN